MILALIFDLDGLLADTETLHRRAYRDVFREYGIEISDETYAEHWIRSGRGIVEFLGERGLAIEPDTIRVKKAARYAELVATEATPMPGAVSLLRRVHGRKKLALASSSYADAVDMVLRTLGMRHFFDAVAAKEHVQRTKPHPDIFLYVADKLETAPSACLVLEDAEKGVVAASAAGMKCIAVPSEHTRNNDFTRADLVLGSLDEVDLRLIDSMG